MSKKIIFSSGGTGGHIFPAVNLMKHLNSNGYEVLLVTDDRGNQFVKKNYDFRSIIIKAYTPTNKNFFKKFFCLILIFYTIFKSVLILKKEKPDLIIGFGGYVSFPICFASKFLKIPLIVYENNLALGRANKKLLPFANKLILGSKVSADIFKKYESKIFYVGNILREEIINKSFEKKELDKEYFSILVLGGSQGAEIFGKVIPSVIKMLKDKGYKIKINQQCKIEQKSQLQDFYNKNNIKNNVFEFKNNIVDLMKSSNVAITRCGASATAELVNTLTPFIAIPYPSAIDNHQYLNAKYYENLGCCWLLNEENLNSENLYDLLIKIVKDRDKLENIVNNMKKNGSKDVYIKIVKLIKELI